MASSALASAVIYTDSAHPLPTGTDIPVVYLDAPERVQAQLFGQLSADPAQAERDARAVLSSARFRQAEQQLTDAYGGVTRAWSLGLEKYPAVVFDDQYVVYGTTDVTLAEQRLKAWQEGQR
jgi:integrating conjugative element protein (TIGR03757 family)